MAGRGGAVSIIVVNHNYARFLEAAIDSALAQTHDDVEVIVVDDGSTDGSGAVIERYRDRVVAVLKQNGGQASAFNAGFARASGSAVVFLDADDVLDERTAALVAAVVRNDPELAKVHYRLAVVDAQGRFTGELTPPSALELPTGDLRELLRRYPDDVPYPPSSGNAFAAWALQRVLPMPEEQYRVLADVYLLNVVPLLGPVAALDGVGGRYRVHGANSHYASRLRLESVRQTVRATHVTHGYMKVLADSLGLSGFPDPDRDDRSLVFLSHRLVSRKLEPRLHPLARDTPWGLARRGAATALRRRDLGLAPRFLFVVWFVLTAAAPRRAAAWLGEQMLCPGRRVTSRLWTRLRRRS